MEKWKKIPSINQKEELLKFAECQRACQLNNPCTTEIVIDRGLVPIIDGKKKGVLWLYDEPNLTICIGFKYSTWMQIEWLRFWMAYPFTKENMVEALSIGCTKIRERMNTEECTIIYGDAIILDNYNNSIFHQQGITQENLLNAFIIEFKNVGIDFVYNEIEKRFEMTIID